MARKKSAAKRAREEEAKLSKAETIEVKPSKDSTQSKTVEPTVASDQEAPEDNDDSLSEEEDEYGELVTNEVEAGINQVLTYLRNNETSRLLDPNTKFFEDPETAVTKLGSSEKEKPLYLKDYHRINLLSGGYKDEEDEDEEGQGPENDDVKPFALEQQETRDQILSDIKKAFNEDQEDDDDDEDDNGDGFLKKKKTSGNVLNEKWVPLSRLPNPERDGEGFLNSFISNEAWIPTKDDKTINLDKIDTGADADFDDAVEDFEHAYNFRYEDPNAAEIISYARNQATVRRSATNSRKRQREKKKEQKIQEEKETDELFKKRKTQKINNVMDNLKKIKEAVGEDIDDELIQKVFGESLLDDDFDDLDWDNKMAQIFNDDFYEEGTDKPQVDDLYGDDGDEEEVKNGSTKKSKKELLKEKKSAKKAKEAIKETAESIVEANALKIRDEVEEERGRSKGVQPVKFKYREVSPESFGLTTRDILLADDKQLNLYIGMKKFAPYKPKEAALKDKRKYTKKKQLQQWRYETFNDRNGPSKQEGEADNEIWLPMEELEEPKRKKRKHNK
ncbi:KRRI-Interacting protein 1 [Scheffersomyces spartinae]|uniref:KRRI-Interacting protein 1 n=1 Tax=Scheffersomyces spartinae TaxID=45513 RepID=A0A9P7V7D9_9ASCO|nr:KRRI-Interacting protein 1 [Scheffersomyces spartinae]KAG7192586.1 KRRI-Interacting protein 1 [Scheffersomyces spartinae]